MIAPFDIFEVENAGSVVWRGTAATLEEAKARVGELAAASPGEYFILSQRTGNRIVVGPDDAGERQSAAS
jgi:hypothetical protein